MDGAEVIVYPAANRSEPHRTAANRIGVEGPLSFHGSLFISDPYGRGIVEARRNRPVS
jgi:predicted amidohydrolase